MSGPPLSCIQELASRRYTLALLKSAVDSDWAWKPGDGIALTFFTARKWMSSLHILGKHKYALFWWVNGVALRDFVLNLRTRAAGLDTRANKFMGAISSDVFFGKITWMYFWPTDERLCVVASDWSYWISSAIQWGSTWKRV